MTTTVEIEQTPAPRHAGRPVIRPCGTVAAYRRHLKAGEPPCEPCRIANRERVNLYRQP